MLIAFIIQTIFFSSLTAFIFYKKNIDSKNTEEFTRIKKEKDNLIKELLINNEKYNNLSIQHDDLTVKTNELERSNQNFIEKHSTLSANYENLLVKITELKQNNQDIFNKLSIRENEFRQLEKIKNEIEMERNTFKNKIDEQNKNIKVLMEMQDQIKSQFKLISNEVIEHQKENFDKQQKNTLGILLNPLKIEIEQFKNKIIETDKNTNETKAVITTHINNLIKQTLNIGEKADNLANALKGDKKAQGNWGELQLKNLFESIGLVEDRDYFCQYEIKDMINDDKQYYLDFVLNLPQNKSLIIDSKVSLNNYENYINSKNETEKNEFFKEYCNDIKRHIETLGSKEYQRVFKDYKNMTDSEAIDFIFMFMPLESAYIEVASKDNSIFTLAFKNKISIVTASSLMPVVRMIQHLWNIEKQNRNIEEIVNLSINMYEKTTKFVEHLNNIGEHLDKAKNSYSQAYGYLATGRANVIDTANKIPVLVGKSKVKNSNINIHNSKILINNNENNLFKIEDNE